jgi:hypothetical protein
MSEYTKYDDAYQAAVRLGRELRKAGLPENQCDIGLEYNKLFSYYRIFMLPSPANRYGHETQCEVVRLSSPLTEVES